MAQPSFRFSTRDLVRKIQEAMQTNREQALRTMREVSHYMRDQSKKRAPKLAGNLSNDITPKVVEYKKSFAAVVYIPTNAPSSAYAIKMHEGTYQLGTLSREKQSKEGVLVGPKYIVRALDDNRDKIFKIIAYGMRM